MKFKYLSPRNIKLTEHIGSVPIFLSADEEGNITMELPQEWSAVYDGNSFYSVGLTGTGPDVYMERYGKTADEAYQNLVNALTEQGWEMKQ